MAKKKKVKLTNSRATRAILQKIESVGGAGVTEVPRVPWDPPADLPEVKKAAAETPKAPKTKTPPKKKSPVAAPAKPAAKSIDIPTIDKPADLFQHPKLPKKDARIPSLCTLLEEVAACQNCAALVKNRTQTVFGVGNPYADLVFLGEAPGADEDRDGIPFVGRAGRLLTDIIQKGMQLPRNDVFIMNILRCRPPGNRNPLPVEAEACRTFVDRTLDIIKPRWICCLGAIAAQNLLQTTTPIGKMRGNFYDYRGIRVVCTYHPAYLLRSPNQKHKTWEDIQLLMKDMGLPLPAGN